MHPLNKQTFKRLHGVMSLLVVIGCCLNTALFADSDCGNNPQAVQLAQLIRQHPHQARTTIKCNALLTKIAEQKAQLLSEHSILMHNIGRLSPNQNLQKNGYPLSKDYSTIGNQVEAIAAGNKYAHETFEQLLNSENHRHLLLGQQLFYQYQNELGVAYVRETKSPYDYYWVIYIADHDHRPKPESELTVISEFKLDLPEYKTSIRERHRQSRAGRPLMTTDQ